MNYTNKMKKKINMKNIIVCLVMLFSATVVFAQESGVQHISRLEIGKKDRENIRSSDSTVTLIIDTLIMHDRAHLEFFGKKKVNLTVKHAFLPKRAYISGTDGKNNAADMDITMRFEELGSVYVLAGGRDANNGSRTFPNGNGGDVEFKYLADGITPQQEDKKADNYLEIDTKAGGYSVNARSDLYNIYSRIGSGARPLGQLPQGQVYSGSPGVDGKATVEAVTSF